METDLKVITADTSEVGGIQWDNKPIFPKPAPYNKSGLVFIHNYLPTYPALPDPEPNGAESTRISRTCRHRF